MSIVLTRIDNRLIHGQVLEAWVPHVHADCIAVANDAVAATSLQKILMEAAVPRGIKVVIGSLEEVAERLRSGSLDGCRVLLLFATCDDALEAFRLGVDFAELNLGNLHGDAGKVRCSSTIALDGNDIQNLHLLEEGGVKIVARCIPSDREQGWHKLIQDRQI